jgi:hypothetical protein
MNMRSGGFETRYPEGIDLVWLASDRNDHLGAFITAGAGPIPIQTLDRKSLQLTDIEGVICGMPQVPAARLLVSVPRPDSFAEMAERGVFVYDWSDVHRTTREAILAYEPVAAPTHPITVNMPPANLAEVAMGLKFAEVAFSSGQALDPRTYMRCLEGG